MKQSQYYRILGCLFVEGDTKLIKAFQVTGKQFMQKMAKTMEKKGTEGSLRKYFHLKEDEKITKQMLDNESKKLEGKKKEDGTYPEDVLKIVRKINAAKRFMEAKSSFIKAKSIKNSNAVVASLWSTLIMYLKNTIGLIETDRGYNNVILTGKPNQYGDTIEFLQSEGFKKITSNKWVKGKVDVTITKGKGFKIEITE